MKPMFLRSPQKQILYVQFAEQINLYIRRARNGIYIGMFALCIHTHTYILQRRSLDKYTSFRCVPASYQRAHRKLAKEFCGVTAIEKSALGTDRYSRPWCVDREDLWLDSVKTSSRAKRINEIKPMALMSRPSRDLAMTMLTTEEKFMYADLQSLMIRREQQQYKRLTMCLFYIYKIVKRSNTCNVLITSTILINLYIQC